MKGGVTAYNRRRTADGRTENFLPRITRISTDCCRSGFTPDTDQGLPAFGGAAGDQGIFNTECTESTETGQAHARWRKEEEGRTGGRCPSPRLRIVSASAGCSRANPVDGCSGLNLPPQPTPLTARRERRHGEAGGGRQFALVGIEGEKFGRAELQRRRHMQNVEIAMPTARGVLG